MHLSGFMTPYYVKIAQKIIVNYMYSKKGFILRNFHFKKIIKMNKNIFAFYFHNQICEIKR